MYRTPRKPLTAAQKSKRDRDNEIAQDAMMANNRIWGAPRAALDYEFG